jgi:hypothetical protein
MISYWDIDLMFFLVGFLDVRPSHLLFLVTFSHTLSGNPLACCPNLRVFNGQAHLHLLHCIPGFKFTILAIGNNAWFTHKES